jgi:hypothetical protein
MVLRTAMEDALYILIRTFKFQDLLKHIMLLSPLPPSQRPWSISVLNAYQQLYQIYQTGSSYVELGSMETHRLQQYGETIISNAYPVLLLLTDSAASESLPMEWIENVAAEFTALLALIDEAWVSAKEEYVESFIRFI